MFEDATSIIFDLDGTLYEDTNHFEYYANLLEEQVERSNRQAFREDYNRVIEGEHALQIGTVYDVNSDAILSVDPFTNEIQEAFSWSGEKIDCFHGGPLEYDFDSMIAIGDGWWLPSSVATHYGVSSSVIQQCYEKTKEYMVSDQFTVTKTPGLKQALHEWKESKKLFLITNSEAYDVNNLLQRLELEGIFDEVTTSARKPQQTYHHFRHILNKNALTPARVISIGDNFMNDIAPALVLGMKAVYVHRCKHTWHHPQLMTTDSLSTILL